MKKIHISLGESLRIVKEGDVLLYRNKNVISCLVGRAGEGQYSHVSVVSKNGGFVECVEFKEWRGGRAVSLQRVVENYDGEIDVYRISPVLYKYKYSFNEKNIISEEKVFNTSTARKVTNCMREMTGLPYGWTRILWIFLHKFPFTRYFYDINKLTVDVPSDEQIYPVCSTSLAHCFNKAGFDLVNHRSDEFTEPNDIARSSILSYVFTIKKP